MTLFKEVSIQSFLDKGVILESNNYELFKTNLLVHVPGNITYYYTNPNAVEFYNENGGINKIIFDTDFIKDYISNKENPTIKIGSNKRNIVVFSKRAGSVVARYILNISSSNLNVAYVNSNSLDLRKHNLIVTFRNRQLQRVFSGIHVGCTRFVGIRKRNAILGQSKIKFDAYYATVIFKKKHIRRCFKLSDYNNSKELAKQASIDWLNSQNEVVKFHYKEIIEKNISKLTHIQPYGVLTL